VSESRLPPGIRLHRGRYQVRYWGKDGRQHARSFARKSDATRFKAAIETDKDRGDWSNPRRAREPFGTVAERYLDHKLRLRTRTREKYESTLRCNLIPGFGTTPVEAITREDVQGWVAGLVRAGRAPETVRGHYDLLAAILKRAEDDGIIAKTPCRNIELPRVLRPEQRYLDEAEVERLATVHPPRYRTLIYSAAYLGPRWQELAGLQRSRLDMRPGRSATMRIVTTIERSHGHYNVVEYGKSETARRTLKMPEFLREMLAWHLGAFPSDEWVFPSPSGGFLRYDNFRRRVWVPAVEDAQLAPLKFHELRHSAVAFMIAEGADPLQIKRRAGHEDVRTTFNLYGHLFPDREDELVAALDRRRSAALERDVDQAWTKRTGDVVALDRERASEQVLLIGGPEGS
jgi:integrase